MRDEASKPEPYALDNPAIFLNCLTVLKDESQAREEGVAAIIEYMKFNMQFSDMVRSHPSEDHVFRVAVAAIALLHTLPGAKISDEMLNKAALSGNMANSGYATSMLLSREGSSSIGASITHSDQDFTIISLERICNGCVITLSLGFDDLAYCNRSWLSVSDVNPNDAQFRTVREEYFLDSMGTVKSIKYGRNTTLAVGDSINIEHALALITDSATLKTQIEPTSISDFKI